MPEISLRPYQIQIIEQCRALMAFGNKSILVTAPTGSGKTFLVGHMLKSAAAKGMPSLFICHRRELIKQTSKAFDAINLDHGIIAASFPKSPHQLVQVCSINTLINRLDEIRTPSLIVYDESQHLGAASWTKLFRHYPAAFSIGVTASPVRLDGKGLGDYFKSLVLGPSVRWLIDNKFLSPYKAFAPPTVSTTGMHTRMGDFVQSEVVAAVDKPSITGSAIAEYIKRANGKRAIVFCASIEHSQHVADQFNLNNIPAQHVDGTTPRALRDQALQDFSDDKTKVLCNVDLFGEGLDVPAVEAVIMLRPTKSLGLFIQQAGRSLRPHPGKQYAIILDHVGNIERHGMPCQHREWSLDGTPKQKKSDKPAAQTVKVCPACLAAQYAGPTHCEFCGFLFPVNKNQIIQKPGDLVELDPNTITISPREKQAAIAAARTLDDFLKIAKQNGYKPGWAHIRYNLRLRNQRK